MHKINTYNIEKMHIICYSISILGGGNMYFRRKVYDKLLEWKKKYSDKYAILLEGARRVGKSTIAVNFAQNEYKSYILLDFSKTSNNILECFDDIGKEKALLLKPFYLMPFLM